MSKKRSMYIPSFTVGPLGNALEKNEKLPDNSTLRFWDESFEPEYQHKAMLLTAGHKYKDMDYSKKFNFPEDMNIFGDSGGYQIATGVLKFDDKLVEEIFNWLEENSTIAMNLDIPPRMKMKGKFDECLELSYKNYKYFEKNQTGKTKFLNILHGDGDLKSYQKWYNKVKGMDFQGWAIGGNSNWKLIVMTLAVLANDKEHLNLRNEFFHILGRSRVSDIFLICRIQKIINDFNSNMTITTDSSTPSLSTAFGNYFYGFDLNNDAFKMLTFPRSSGNSKNANAPLEVSNCDCLNTNAYTNRLFRNYSPTEMGSFKSEHYAAMAVQNFTIFLDAFKFSEKLANSDDYFIREILGPKRFKLVKIIDAILTDENPLKVYAKYEPVLDQLSPPMPTDFAENTFF